LDEFGPAVRLGRRRHVDHFEEIAGLVQHGNCATSAGVNPRTRPQQANYAILELEHGAISNPDHGSKFGKVAFSDAGNVAARRFAEQTRQLEQIRPSVHPRVTIVVTHAHAAGDTTLRSSWSSGATLR
jgi:hypothetical protein